MTVFVEEKAVKDKVLLAGPWVGEFGWELFCWQAHVRRLSKDYKETYVISRPGHGILYADFASKFYEFDPKSWKTNMNECEDGIDPKSLIDSIEYDDYLSGRYFMDISYDGLVYKDNKGHFGKQIFHKYTGNEAPFDDNVKTYDLLLHPRNKPTGADRNWDAWRWQQLVDELQGKYTMAVIGNDQAYSVKGADDLRGISLHSLVKHINQCGMVVGPSSGPMHLASLCGKKHLVWTPEFNRIRYETWWNPFNTEVILCTEGNWHPKVETVKNKIYESLICSGIQPNVNEHSAG
jgi:hypothetical protein